jgi:hypothetical protein
MTPTQDFFLNPFNPMRAQQTMGMSPAMPSMLPPIQQYQTGQPEQSIPANEESPITRGLTAGIGAGRQSLEMDARQRDAAMGLLIAKMFGGMAASKNPTTLGALNEGLSGGIDSYQAHANQIAKMNLLEMERQDSLAKELQRQKEREEDRKDLQRHRNQALSLKREELSSKYGKDEEDYSTDEVLSDSVALNSMTKKQSGDAFKEMQGRVATGSSLKGVLSTLDEMQKLSDENPHLGDSFAVAYNASKDGKGMSNIIKNVTLGKDRVAVEKFGKLSSRLVQHQIKSIKGPATDRMKKIILESTPSAGMTKDALDYLIRTGREEALPHYEDALRAREGILKKRYVPVKLDEYKMNESSMTNVDPRIQKAKDAGYTEEEIMQIMQE